MGSGHYFLFPRWWVVRKHYASFSLTEKAVLPVLGSHFGNTRSCWPATRTIGELAGVSSPNAIIAALKSLEKRKAIRIGKRFNPKGGVNGHPNGATHGRLNGATGNRTFSLTHPVQKGGVGAVLASDTPR